MQLCQVPRHLAGHCTVTIRAKFLTDALVVGLVNQAKYRGRVLLGLLRMFWCLCCECPHHRLCRLTATFKRGHWNALVATKLGNYLIMTGSNFFNCIKCLDFARHDRMTRFSLRAASVDYQQSHYEVCLVYLRGDRSLDRCLQWSPSQTGDQILT